MNFIRNTSLFLLLAGLALPGCASKKRNKVAQIENELVEDRIIESEKNESEESSKEDLSLGL